MTNQRILVSQQGDQCGHGWSGFGTHPGEGSCDALALIAITLFELFQEGRDGGGADLTKAIRGSVTTLFITITKFAEQFWDRGFGVGSDSGQGHRRLKPDLLVFVVDQIGQCGNGRSRLFAEIGQGIDGISTGIEVTALELLDQLGNRRRLLSDKAVRWPNTNAAGEQPNEDERIPYG